MSAKISGYRVMLGSDSSVFAFSKDVRAILQPVFQATLRRMLMQNALTAEVLYRLNGDASQHSRFPSVWMAPLFNAESYEHIRKVFDFSLVLYDSPYGHEDEWTYFSVHGLFPGEKLFIERLRTQYRIEEFSSNGQVDDLSDISALNSDYIYETWDRIGIIDGAPIEVGLQIVILAEGWEFEAALKAVRDESDTSLEFEYWLNQLDKDKWLRNSIQPHLVGKDTLTLHEINFPTFSEFIQVER